MGDLLKYLKQFLIEHFKPSYLLLILMMLGLIIYCNYFHGLERRYINSGGWFLHFIKYYLLYFIPFFGAFLLQIPFYKNLQYFRSGWFWTIILLAPAFFSFRVNFNWQKEWIENYFPASLLKFYSPCINWIVRVIVLLIPVIIIWWLKDRNNQKFYGANPVKVWRPYLYMLLCMIPQIALAGSSKEFLEYYPRVKVVSALPLQGRNSFFYYLFFELCYGIDFISIEFFFRGFLVLSLLKICGSKSIIPIACFYCSIHLGKPMGEAISSFWGGALLGIIAFETKSIWGGLLVHLGIAWMMEIAGGIGLFYSLQG